jgi:predicted RNA-binding protein with PUA-like domain
MPVKYWLFKSEPSTYSIDDLAKDDQQSTCWEGVRNYQARNLLRDEIRLGDRVLFYHSACKEPGVVGTAVVIRPGYPDHFAWDRRSKYYDSKSDPDYPTWYMVDIRLDKKFPSPVMLAAIRDEPALQEMELLRKGSRLSIQPVTKKEFDTILRRAGGGQRATGS